MRAFNTGNRKTSCQEADVQSNFLWAEVDTRDRSSKNAAAKFWNTVCILVCAELVIRRPVTMSEQASLFVWLRILEILSSLTLSITLFHSLAGVSSSIVGGTVPCLKSNSDGAAFPPSSCRFSRPQTLLKRNFLSEKLTLPFCTLLHYFFRIRRNSPPVFTLGPRTVFLSVKKNIRAKFENANLPGNGIISFIFFSNPERNHKSWMSYGYR